jgi:hypothetical protein
VRFDVAVGEEIVEESPEELADDAADDGREVEERGVRVFQEIQGRLDELCYGCYDAGGLGEEHEDTKIAAKSHATTGRSAPIGPRRPTEEPCRPHHLIF